MGRYLRLEPILPAPVAGLWRSTCKTYGRQKKKIKLLWAFETFQFCTAVIHTMYDVLTLSLIFENLFSDLIMLIMSGQGKLGKVSISAKLASLRLRKPSILLIVFVGHQNINNCTTNLYKITAWRNVSPAVRIQKQTNVWNVFNNCVREREQGRERPAKKHRKTVVFFPTKISSCFRSPFDTVTCEGERPFLFFLFHLALRMCNKLSKDTLSHHEPGPPEQSFESTAEIIPFLSIGPLDSQANNETRKSNRSDHNNACQQSVKWKLWFSARSSHCDYKVRKLQYVVRWRKKKPSPSNPSRSTVAKTIGSTALATCNATLSLWLEDR